MKYIRLIVFTAVVVLLSGTSFAALPNIFIENVDPQPVEPGSDFTIDVRLSNRMDSPTGSFDTSISAVFPLIFKSSRDNMTAMNLCGLCSTTNRLYMSVDPSAISGTYTTYFRAYSGGTESLQRVDIKVQGKPNIIFLTPSSELNNITPETEFDVVLNLTNIGTGYATQVRVEPNSQDFKAIGGYVQALKSIAPGQEETVVFRLVAVEGLVANSYSIPFKISYLDESGKSYSAEQSLGVRVINKGRIDIQTIKIADAKGAHSVTAGQPFAVVVRLENVGPGSARSVSAEINCPFSGDGKAFLGQLKKDEDAPAVFNLVSADAGNFECELSVSFDDDLGAHEFSEKFLVSVKPVDISGSVTITIVVLVVLGFVFRKKMIRALRSDKHVHSKA